MFLACKKVHHTKTNTHPIQNEAEVQIPFFAIVPGRDLDFFFSPVFFSEFSLYTRSLELVTTC